MSDSVKLAINHFHGLIERDLAEAESQLQELREKQRERKATFGERPMAHSLRPTFVTESRYAEVQDVVYLIRQAALQIAATFFNDEQTLRHDLGMEEWEIKLAALPTDLVRLSHNTRLDAFLTEHSFKFVEINAESPAGIAYIHELGTIYQELEIFEQFQKTFPTRFVSPLQHALQGFVRTYHEEFGGTEEHPSFAIVDHMDVPTVHEFKLIQAYLQRHGHTCEVVDPRELECRNGWIYANGTKIDILYRRLLMNEFHEIRDDCSAYLQGYQSQKTCYLNSFRAKLLHKKAIFSFLTDENYTQVLSSQQQDAIRKHIPWTRILRNRSTSFRGLAIDLVKFVRSNREYFVIKPNDEYGGTGVTLGFDASQSEWDTAIEEGLQAGHVVQETVSINREPFLTKTEDGWDVVPSIIDLNPYVNGPLVGGCLTRTSASNLANVTAGGGTLPMFILRNTYETH